MSMLALTLVMLTSAAQELELPSAAEQRAGELERLVDAPTPEARRALAASMARARGGNPVEWAAAMAGFGRFDAASAGNHSETIELVVLGKRVATELWIYVPAKYAPAKPAPLMLSFHGTGGSGQGMHSHWQRTADDLGMLVLAPSEPGENTGYRFDDRERAAALAALRWTRRKYNVDENRVYASGISRGGHLTWDLALRYPDRFAAVAPMIGSPRITMADGQNNMRLLENVAQLPIRDLQGSKDDAGLVYSVRLAFDLLGKFAPRDAQLIEFPDLGHSFDMTAVDWPTWLGSNSRNPLPERIVRCTATKDEGRAHWLEIRAVDKDVREDFRPEIPEGEWSRLSEDGQRRRYVAEVIKRNARAVARRNGPGSYTLDLDGATKVRLYLRAEDLDENGGVRISLGGKYLARKVQADVKSMLEEFAERFDRRFIPVGYVDVP